MSLLGLAGAVHADRGNCLEEWVCIEIRTEGGVHVLSARNLRDWPATLSLRLDEPVLAAEPDIERTVTLAGGTHAELIRVRVAAGSVPRYQWAFTPGARDVDADQHYAYRLPYPAGEAFMILQGFGSRFSHRGREHYAVDFDMPIGTPVHAARSGVVVRAVDAHDGGCWEPECASLANYVAVLHDDETTGEYYHLRQHGVLVEVGEHVTRGQLIAYSGNTGHTTMPHLHFAVYRAASWGKTQSLPFRFASADGPIAHPRRGMRPVAVE